MELNELLSKITDLKFWLQLVFGRQERFVDFLPHNPENDIFFSPKTTQTVLFGNVSILSAFLESMKDSMRHFFKILYNLNLFNRKPLIS